MLTTNLKADLIKELGIDQLEPSKQEEVLTAMTEAVLKRLTIRVLEKLPESDRADFEKISQSQDAEKMTNFLKDKIPDFEEIAAQEIADFKKEMTETVNKLIS